MKCHSRHREPLSKLDANGIAVKNKRFSIVEVQTVQRCEHPARRQTKCSTAVPSPSHSRRP
jgi:hypothetical protein